MPLPIFLARPPPPIRRGYSETTILPHKVQAFLANPLLNEDTRVNDVIRIVVHIMQSNNFWATFSSFVSEMSLMKELLWRCVTSNTKCNHRAIYRNSLLNVHPFTLISSHKH